MVSRSGGRAFSQVVGRGAGISCPGCISETIRGRVLMLGRDIG